ncbi:hypothetical protein L6164_003263 [Bauhinia variegata]|uniref:Uncharacterized protein n=1 Tax=Bauhinia variegata TaxID=167791 RepID=A0ACB9Q0R2_BAUVA|nr:hypothetical protein L6164_003263 [Bauhinia variegata]
MAVEAVHFNCEVGHPVSYAEKGDIRRRQRHIILSLVQTHRLPQNQNPHDPQNSQTEIGESNPSKKTTYFWELKESDRSGGPSPLGSASRNRLQAASHSPATTKKQQLAYCRVTNKSWTMIDEPQGAGSFSDIALYDDKLYIVATNAPDLL